MGTPELNIPLFRGIRISVRHKSKDIDISYATNGIVTHLGTQGIVFNSYDGIEFYFTFDMIIDIKILDDKDKEKM